MKRHGCIRDKVMECGACSSSPKPSPPAEREWEYGPGKRCGLGRAEAALSGSLSKPPVPGEVSDFRLVLEAGGRREEVLVGIEERG
jgi:hypothetical protein